MDDIKGLLKKYKNISEERFFKEIFNNKEYKPALYRKADVVIDVGACAGEFSAYIYRKAKVIYALEPFSEHFEELSNNVRDFGLSKIKPFKLALSNYNGEGTLVVGNRGGHKLVGGGSSEKTEKVDVKTLATFMEDEGMDQVDVLKIDIENGETEVFTSPDFTREVARKINYMIGEHSNSEVSDTLRKYGFYFVDRPRGWIAKRK